MFDAATDRRLNIAGDGHAARVIRSVIDIRPQPDEAGGIDTQALFGERLTIFETRAGWHRVQLAGDRYVGWTQASGVGDAGSAPTHIITAPRSYAYTSADLKSPRLRPLSMSSQLVVTGEEETRGTRYLLLEGEGAVVADHARPINEHETDYVAVAESFERTPYLWGGASGFGIDCSGLVQLSQAMCGVDVLRDSDMQAATAGEAINWRGPLQRGDLVFWNGHVGIMCDSEMLLHANGNTMDVAREPLAEAITRIAFLYGEPTGARRF